MKDCIKSISIVLALAILPVISPGQQNSIGDFHHIKFEYHNIDSTRTSPLIICVPGFTQHNRSEEFTLIKNYFTANSFSYLIMNPPQHGEIYTKSRIYTWGEREVADLLSLTLDSLRVFDRHSTIHLLGFSIGAKIVLNYSAKPRVRSKIASTIAVAAPFRVGAINGQVLGKGINPQESLLSSFAANKRAGFLRLGYMVFPGMFVALLKNRASPAENIAQIQSPLLLLHGSDDWLTKSYHSKQLFEKARLQQRIAFIALDTPIHAEDMLTRGSADLRKAFFKILSCWYEFSQQTLSDTVMEDFNAQFTKVLKMNESTSGLNYPIERITRISSPTLNDRRSNIWATPANQNPAAFSLHSSFAGNDQSRYFLSFAGPRKYRFLSRFQGGLAFEKTAGNNLANTEAYLSIYYPFGSFIWMRKLTYIQTLKKANQRKILSADLALLLLDFQLNYGDIRSPVKKEWQLNFNFPLINLADGRFFCGFNYSRFLNSIMPESDFAAYFFIGPQVKKSRWHVFSKYHFLNKSRWRFGLALYLFDR